MNWKIILWTVLAVTLLSMNGCVPGSEKWNIRIAAYCYIKGGGLQDGEKLLFINGIQRNYEKEWQGQRCKYVAVKYTFLNTSGELDQRYIFLLMTENCDSVIDCSYDGKAKWVSADNLLIIKL